MRALRTGIVLCAEAQETHTLFAASQTPAAFAFLAAYKEKYILKAAGFCKKAYFEVGAESSVVLESFVRYCDLTKLSFFSCGIPADMTQVCTTPCKKLIYNVNLFTEHATLALPPCFAGRHAVRVDGAHPAAHGRRPPALD